MTGTSKPTDTVDDGNAVAPRLTAQSYSFTADSDEFHLRNLVKSDVDDAFIAWMNDPDVLNGLNLPPLNLTMAGLHNYIAMMDNRQKFLIGIFAKQDMMLIGFYQVDINLLHRTASLTAAVGKQEWYGKGVLRRTAKVLIETFFNSGGIEKFSVKISGKNKRILYSLMGTKFEYEGCLKSEVLSPDGQRLDQYCFGWVKS